MFIEFYPDLIAGIFLGPSIEAYRNWLRRCRCRLNQVNGSPGNLDGFFIHRCCKAKKLDGSLFLSECRHFLIFKHGLYWHLQLFSVISDLLYSFHQVPVAGARGILLG
jgi:hypothetical protein